MESIIQFFMDISGNHITRYGLYIPGEPYKFILWNELLVIILSFALTIVVLKNRALKRHLLVQQAKSYFPVYRPYQVILNQRNSSRHVDLEIVKKMVMDYDYLRIKYIDFKGNVTERTIEYYNIYQQEGNWYIEAFCWLRCEKRTFRADRILDIKPATDISYEPPLPEYPGEDVIGDDIYQ
jgi:predicted DNA-binding transcriptional regulator YafY